MNHFDLLLQNGTCVVLDPHRGLRSEKCDLGIRNEKIVSINPSSSATAEKIFDAKGLHILPGIIDSQVHFREPGLTHKEDIETGTRSALLGGITSIFEMPNTNPSTTTAAAFQEKLQIAKTKAWVHHAFFIGASADNADQLKELEKLPHCAGVKIFMGSSTGSLLVDEEIVLEKILKSGSRRVIVHAEDEARLKERKHIATEGAHAQFHPQWRDEETAFIATERLIRLARKTGRKVHVLHVTSKKEIEFLAKNKDIATVEILPQHLFFAAPECYDRLGSLVQMNPPIREAVHQQALWNALKLGVVDVMATDHAPHTKEEKNKVYPNSPSGLPGVQTFVPLMLNFVHQGKISLEKFVELTTLGPRKVFGLKNKGLIAVGADADFTIVDLQKRHTFTNEEILSRCGWTPYCGETFTGMPVATILNGQIAMQDGHITTSSPLGKAVEFET